MMRGADRWLLPLLARHTALASGQVRHVFLAICDHFEPLHHTDEQGALARLERWAKDYPRMAARVRDSSNRGPRHTFFYPIEQYDAEQVSRIADICAATGSEIEVQLHHDGDTETTLIEQIQRGVENLRQHGCLATDPDGKVRFGFVHGNWALCNSRPDGRWCGVPTEVSTLRRLGCYGDFTFPSAPSPTQPRSVNQIGYARECGSAAALSSLSQARAGATAKLRSEQDHLLLIQGPLALNWSRRKWGVLPRLENADLTAANPPSASRLKLWIEQQVQVLGRPDWLFIKLHCHGAVPENASTLLGNPMHEFNDCFTGEFARSLGTQVHYVTAREMANLVHAAEDQVSLPPAECFNYWFKR